MREIVVKMRLLAALILLAPALALAMYPPSSSIQYPMHRSHVRSSQLVYDYQNDDKTIAEHLKEDDRFSRLRDLLKESKDLRDDLDSTKQWTLFAPMNEAFEHFNQTEYKIKEVLIYHLTNGSIGMNELKDGMTLPSELKEKALKNRRQILRVVKRDNELYINMMGQITDEIQASNGRILAMDRVLTPPPDMMESLLRLPTMFSTLVAAVFRTKLNKVLKEEKAITVFAPDNRAWDAIDLHDMIYLFSKDGDRDLEKILKYHVVPSLVYGSHFRRENQMKLKTMNKGMEIEVHAQRQLAGATAEENAYVRRLLAYAGASGFFGQDDQQDDPEGWHYQLNQGAAEIGFADGPVENGVVHLISAVLIPENVHLPSKGDGEY